MRNALMGVAVSLLASLITAVLFAYVFRLPIPFSGYIGPFGAASTWDLDVAEVLRHVGLAWLLYGMLGGFVVLLMIGAITGMLAGRRYAGLPRMNRMLVLWVSAVSALPVFALSVLDYVIRPW